MNNSYKNPAKGLIFTALRYSLIPVFLLLFHINSFSQTGYEKFDKVKRDKTYKKGTNIEYYKNGNIKSISQYKRKVFWYYTDTYWTIKEYDMEGNQIRLIKKVTQMARRENTERIIKEEITTYEPKKENQPKENIRPE